MAEMVNLKINDIDVNIKEGSTILEAAKLANIKIPTLCYHEDLCVAGNCRVCVVEQSGVNNLKAACATPVEENMEVYTNTSRVREARKTVIGLLLSEHNNDCPHCYKNGNCELQTLAKDYLVDPDKYINILRDYTIDRSSPSIIKDDSKCIKCQRCVRTCDELQDVNALCVSGKGSMTKISTFFEKPMDSVTCTNCGQCVAHCPTGALVERDYIDEVWETLSDPTNHVVIQTAPAVRVGIGEAVGLEPGQRLTGKMVTALKKIGFDAVFDTNFSADLTIMEEVMELLTRLKRKIIDNEDVALPQFTSCSPGWIKYIEHEFPDILDNLSTCKSPQQMLGALAKTYYARNMKIDPENIVVVSIMPCTAKKFEADRPEMYSSGYKDVDYVLTTREFGKMIEQAGINFESLQDSECDSILGKHTGAGVIFGATGGVMEAALRTAYEIITGREVPFSNINIMPVRGLEGVREAAIKIEDCRPEWKFLENVDLKVAVAHGLSNARKLAEQVSDGKSPYHFIEIMACPGGCLSGGGQPIPVNNEIRKKRTEAIYAEDESLEFRKSHENPEIKRIYKDFLQKPLSHKSHELLHTSYTKRKKYQRK